MDDAHLAGYAWDKSIKALMTIKQKLFASCISLTITFLVFTVAMDIIIFYAIPLHNLYPNTLLNENTESVQIAAILFNDFNSTFTEINNETKRRIHHGMSLLENNKVEQLIVVGGNRERGNHNGARLMADYILQQGIPAEEILIEENSKDSISNIKQLGKILAQHNIDTLGLISSPYHLLRIQAMHIEIPFKSDIMLFPYNPITCIPPLTRSEVLFSAHYNAIAYVAHVILPEPLYRGTVMWIREHTEW